MEGNAMPAQIPDERLLAHHTRVDEEHSAVPSKPGTEPAEPPDGHRSDSRERATAMEAPRERQPPSSEAVEPREHSEAVDHPAKLLRIASMIQGALQEMHETELDRAARRRLTEVHNRAVQALGGLLSEDLRVELDEVTLPLRDGTRVPTASELRIAEAQLVGWLEGLLSGIHATIVSQHLAQRQVDEPRRSLRDGQPDSSGSGPYL